LPPSRPPEKPKNRYELEQENAEGAENARIAIVMPFTGEVSARAHPDLRQRSLNLCDLRDLLFKSISGEGLWV